MVEIESKQLDSVFRALSDPTRRAMLRQLAEGEQSISRLGAPFNMSFEGASKHVRALEAAGLVQRTVVGRTHVCRLRPAPLAAADEWLRFYEQFWTRRLDALDALLKSEDAAASHATPTRMTGARTGSASAAKRPVATSAATSTTRAPSSKARKQKEKSA